MQQPGARGAEGRLQPTTACSATGGPLCSSARLDGRSMNLSRRRKLLAKASRWEATAAVLAQIASMSALLWVDSRDEANAVGWFGLLLALLGPSIVAAAVARATGQAAWRSVVVRFNFSSGLIGYLALWFGSPSRQGESNSLLLWVGVLTVGLALATNVVLSFRGS